jgi:glucose/arabinose dehydrogenase
LTGKVLRINRDGTIPKDSPFPSSAIYTLGNTNFFGIAFDNRTLGIVIENDAKHHDVIKVLRKGMNYGDPIQEKQSLQGVNSLQFDNFSGVMAARTYYDVITPRTNIKFSSCA